MGLYKDPFDFVPKPCSGSKQKTDSKADYKDRVSDSNDTPFDIKKRVHPVPDFNETRKYIAENVDRPFDKAAAQRAAQAAFEFMHGVFHPWKRTCR